MKNMDLIKSAQSAEAVEFKKCDSCPASAQYTVSLITGTLDFCRHHYLKNEEKLTLVAITTVEINIQEIN